MDSVYGIYVRTGPRRGMEGEGIANMTCSALVILHLFVAIMFVGTVFFEVLILEAVRKTSALSKTGISIACLCRPS